MTDDNDQGSISAYNPSWTDWVAQKLLGDEKPSTWWSNTVQNLTGSTGLGSTGYLSAKDFVPAAGQVLNAQQAYHDDKPWSEVALNLIPGISTAGREAMLVGDAAEKAIPKAADDVVDLARRSLFAPRAKAAEEAAPAAESAAANPNATPAELSFLNKPVTRRSVNEGIAGAGAAAVLGPEFANDLLHSSIPKVADNVVAPVIKSVVRATPDMMASKLKDMLHKPLDMSIFEKHIPKEKWSDYADPIDFELSLSDEGHNVEMGHVFDNKMMHYPRTGSFYHDPESETFKTLAAVRDDYKKSFREELEASVGHPVTDEEFNTAFDRAKKYHDITTTTRIDSSALDDPEWGEHPVEEYAHSLFKNLAKNTTSTRYPGYKKAMALLNENLTPEGIMTHVWKRPEGEIDEVLDTVDKNGVSMRDHLQAIIDDAKDSGMISEDYFDPEVMKDIWKENAPKIPVKRPEKSSPPVKTTKKAPAPLPEDIDKVRSRVEEMKPRLKELQEAYFNNPDPKDKTHHERWWKEQQEYVKLAKQLQKMERVKAAPSVELNSGDLTNQKQTQYNELVSRNQELRQKIYEAEAKAEKDGTKESADEVKRLTEEYNDILDKMTSDE